MNFVWFLYMVLCFNPSKAGILRYCAPKKTRSGSGSSGVQNACDQLNENQDDIKCLMQTDRLDCFNLLSKGQADFTIAEPEDLRILDKYETRSIDVTHELLKFSESQPQKNVEMVAIVKHGDLNVPWTNRGKKLCYSGIETSHGGKFNYRYNSYFENWNFGGKKCDDNKTIVENRIARLSEYFESACIAGPWTLDPDLDAELKKKYSNLCALCFEPSTCNEGDRYYGPMGAVRCFEQHGEVAWLNRNALEAHLNSIGRIRANNIGLLCPDGVVHSFADNHTCTWIEDPRPVIVAEENVAAMVQQKLVDGSPVLQAIHASYLFEKPHQLDRPVPVKDYLTKFPGVSAAQIKAHNSQCQSSRSVKWCVAEGRETRKCRFLAQAADALGLSPGFTCVSRSTRKDCLQALADAECDVFVVDSAEMTTIENLRVKPVIDMVAHKGDTLNTIAAVVHKNSPFRSYSDLKGAKACFTMYKGVGWNAFYSRLRNGSNRYDCQDTEAISNYFNESCVLGAELSTEHFPPNLYSLCNKTDSSLGIGLRTFKCLHDGADVAFINLYAAQQYAKNENSVFDTEYRILSPSDPAADCSSSLFKCTLARITLGSVLINNATNEVRENDITLLFFSLDRYFGRSYDRETPMFDMYDVYDGEANVIFSNHTVKLQKVIPGLPHFNSTRNSDKLKCDLSKGHYSDSNKLVIVLLLFINFVFF